MRAADLVAEARGALDDADECERLADLLKRAEQAASHAESIIETGAP